MIKRSFKLIILVAVFACIAPFILKGPDGKSLVSVKDFKWPRLNMPKIPDSEKVVKKAKDILPKKENLDDLKNILSWKKNTKVKIYKWQNKDGAWVFSDQPNPDGPYDVMIINPEKDLIHLDVPYDSTGNEIIQKEVQGKNDVQNNMSNLPVPTTVPIGKVPEMIKDAKTVKNELEQRYEKVDQGLRE